MFDLFHKKTMVQSCLIEMKNKLKSHDGCVICHFEDIAVEQYIKSLLYERVNDPKVRKELLSGHGYCQSHAAMLLEAGDSLGTAILYLDQLQNFLWDLDKVYRKQNAKELDTWLDHGSCPVCMHVERHCKNYLEFFIDGLKDDDFRDNLESGNGLCITHLSMVLDNVEDKSQFAFVIKVHRQKYRELLMDVMEFIRKSDHRFRGEGLGREKDSWQRAVKTMTRF
ncbi:MAG: hypothetical protein GY750_01865 [Lentisphaerae bacterium]|nr:hypothetical protein [Lentisphaerota bacterium]MCP4100168.1 hypothetical protein [Lentisphaerota bacterium]